MVRIHNDTVVIGHLQGKVSFWHADQEGRLRSLSTTGPRAAHSESVVCVEVRLATVCDALVQNALPVTSVDTHACGWRLLQPCGESVATADLFGEVFVWDLTLREVVHCLVRPDHTEENCASVTCLQFSPVYLAAGYLDCEVRAFERRPGAA